MEQTLDLLSPHWSPHPGQREFLLAPHLFKVLACGRRWGKTDACAVQALNALLGERRRVLIAAPTQAQSRLLFDRCLDLIGALGIDVRAKTTPHPVAHVGESRIAARSGFVGSHLRGDEATDIIIDEAAYVPEALITEVAMPMLATTNGTLTLLSTPRGQNHFWKFFKWGQDGEHGIWSRAGPTSENPMVAPSFLDMQRELISDRAFRTEYLAEFIDVAGQVFKASSIDACQTRSVDSCENQPISVGIDWARYTDYTAVALIAGTWPNARLVALERWNGLGWREQVARVAEIVRDYPGAQIASDATGVGDPALELLRDQLPNARIKAVVFTNTVKAELIDGLAFAIETAELAIPPHQELLRELHHFTARQSDSGRTIYGARQGYHDDLVIALSLAASLVPRAYHAPIRLADERRFYDAPPSHDHEKFASET